MTRRACGRSSPWAISYTCTSCPTSAQIWLRSPSRLPGATEGAGTSEDVRLSTYQSKVQDYFRALEEGMERLDRHAVSIVLAHVYIADCEFGGGEWRSSVFP